MKIGFTREAATALRRMAVQDATRIRAAIDALCENPRSPTLDIRPLAGREGVHRLRVGDWRVLFMNDGAVLAILTVAHRRDVYR